MSKRMIGLAICIAAFAVSAAAQTVTGSGTSGTVPVFTGSSTVGNSVITQSNGNVGIGTTSQSQKLEVNGTEQVDGNLNVNYVSASGILLQSNPQAIEGWGWNDNLTLYTLGAGGTINNNQLVLDAANGNVGIGTTSPRSGLEVAELDAYYPSTTTTSVRVGGVNPGPSSVALNGVSSTNQILFSSYRDVQANTVGAKISAINNAVYSAGGAGNYWRVQNTDIAFSTLSGYTSSVDSTSEKMRLTAGGNLGIGTAAPGAKLEVDGNVKLTAGSGASITFADGTTQSTAYTGVICGGDYAESVDVSGSRTNYGPGDVLVLDPENPGKVLKSIEAYSTSVSGIYSTKPGTVGRRQTTAKNADEVPMAMMGIVPAKVSAENGPVKVGDLLVSSSTPGYAMKGTDHNRMLGAVIGKAMGKLDSGTGVIEVLVTLQ
jgi:hypothetical protein